MKNKKILLWLLLPFTFFCFLTGAIVYKSINPYKPSIYNYQSYVNPDLIPKIEKKYSYKEYKNNSEFVNAINNNKAIGGISTDYMIIDLINNKKIAKIDFMDAFNVVEPQNFYTKETNDQLNFFDKFLAPEINSQSGIKNDVDGDGKQDHFWEYIIPVWLNNKVFIYNSEKIKLGQKNIPEGEFGDFSSINILKGLHKNGVDVFSWTNAPIENSVLGSEISGQEFNTELTLENFKERIDQFAQIIKEGTGSLINNGERNIFENDSDVILQSIINPKSSISGAYLFNGDALDAYWSEDNFSNVVEGTIKLVKPKNSPSFIDGFVVSSSISKESQIELLKNMNNIFFRGKFMNEVEIEQEIKKENTIDWNKLASINNFDYVNFTPTSKGEYNFILDNYFDKGITGDTAKDFYIINKILPISPINQELQSRIDAYFKRKLRE